VADERDVGEVRRLDEVDEEVGDGVERVRGRVVAVREPRQRRGEHPVPRRPQVLGHRAPRPAAVPGTEMRT
jgi:hypothetical protein